MNTFSNFIIIHLQKKKKIRHLDAALNFSFLNSNDKIFIKTILGEKNNEKKYEVNSAKWLS